jgi:polyferredoxin
MKRAFRILRISLAVLFFTATVLFFYLGAASPEIVQRGARANIATLYLSEGAGILLLWCALTLLLGRVYCSAICPVGILSDIFIRINRHLLCRNKPRRYAPLKSRIYHLPVVYFICLICGFSVVSLLLEPWSIFGNITMLFGAGTMAETWAQYGYGTLIGVVAGVISLILLMIYALFRGRDFCNTLCPLGITLGYISNYAMMKISIDGDKCLSCMTCQDNCKAAAIDVAQRHVDNAKCVRCFNCIANCPNSAINLTAEKKRPMSPMMKRCKV